MILIEPGYIMTNLQNTAAELMETLRGKDYCRALRQDLFRSICGIYEREKEIEDHGGRLRAGHAEGY